MTRSRPQRTVASGSKVGTQDGGTQVEVRRADPLLDWRMRLVARPLVGVTLGMRTRTVARLADRMTELA